MNQNVWEVDFDIVGPISITNNFDYLQQKGSNNVPFYSNISLRKSSYGLRATITAYADNSHTAETVAYVFLGRMIDVLSLVNDLPINLIIDEESSVLNKRWKSRLLLEKSDIIKAFNMARKLEIEEPMLLRAIGWYSKGKTTFNALDKFIAYWNVIEIIG